MIYKELESKRLLFVKMDKQYAQDFYNNFNDTTTRYLTNNRFHSIEECLQFFSYCEKTQNENINYSYIILDKQNNSFIGTIALCNLDYPYPEFGIWIKEDAYGYGFGKEAVKCLYEYAKGFHEYKGFLYPVDIENAKSENIAIALHGVKQGEVEEYKKEDGNILHLVNYILPER